MIFLQVIYESFDCDLTQYFLFVISIHRYDLLNEDIDFCCNKIYHKKSYIFIDVHRCGTSGCMRACHAAGPGSVPGREKFPG